MTRLRTFLARDAGNLPAILAVSAFVSLILGIAMVAAS